MNWQGYSSTPPSKPNKIATPGYFFDLEGSESLVQLQFNGLRSTGKRRHRNHSKKVPGCMKPTYEIYMARRGLLSLFNPFFNFIFKKIKIP